MRSANQDGMIIEFDCEAEMHDGTIIRYDIYRPEKEGQYPCITTYGPYGKGMHFSQGYSLFWRDIKHCQIGKISDNYLSGPETLTKRELIKNRRNYIEEIKKNELIDAGVY